MSEHDARAYGPYHVGFSVPSLEESMAELTTALGVQWRPIVNASFRFPDLDGVVTTVTQRVAYSSGPAPAIELFEGAPGTLLEAGDRPRFHHLGYWVDHLGRRSAEIAGSDWALLRGADDETDDIATVRAAFHEFSFGFVEIVDMPQAKMPELLPEWYTQPR
ncbi:MAG: hypothetical protein EPO13_10045 [Actinomycetota bacterium]|nr:MAG: hypothetical protein EPO13_10045 [Actinomycetota bacterium]